MAEIKSGDTAYEVRENPTYDPVVRALKRSDPADADTVFNPLLGQIINNVHAVYQKASDQNMLINGDFSVWQRGTEFNITANRSDYTADRWRIGTSADLTISASDHVPPGETGKSISFTLQSQVQKDWLVYQFLEEPLELNTDYTLSAWVKGPKGGKYRVSMDDAQAPIWQLTGEWQFIQYCYHFKAGLVTRISPLRLLPDSLEGTYYLKNVKLEKGNKATPFVKRNPAVEKLLCQRYYLALPAATKAWVGTGNQNELWCGIYPPAPMRIPPVFKCSSGFTVFELGKTAVSDMALLEQTHMRNNMIEVCLRKNNHGFTRPYVYTNADGAYFDAEIYGMRPNK